MDKKEHELLWTVCSHLDTVVTKAAGADFPRSWHETLSQAFALLRKEAPYSKALPGDISLFHILRDNNNQLPDHDLAVLADWANDEKNEATGPEWKRAYALLREGADLLLRRRARTAMPRPPLPVSPDKDEKGRQGTCTRCHMGDDTDSDGDCVACAGLGGAPAPPPDGTVVRHLQRGVNVDTASKSTLWDPLRPFAPRE